MLLHLMSHMSSTVLGAVSLHCTHPPACRPSVPRPLPAVQRGQVVTTFNEHLPTVTATGSSGSLLLRPLGQPPLSSSGHLFMSETLDSKARSRLGTRGAHGGAWCKGGVGRTLAQGVCVAAASACAGQNSPKLCVHACA